MSPRKKPGPKSCLTDEQQAQVWEWFQAKRALGTFKTKAKELGVGTSALWWAINNLKRRAGDY